jgi:hypothetical protein
MVEYPNEVQLRFEAIGEQLRAKITSKFQTTTFLAGFAFAVLGFEVSLLWQSTRLPKCLPLSISLMLAALVLYVGAAIKLDELTMPKRFWKPDESNVLSSSSSLGVLNDSDLWELQKRMIFYWTKMSIVATVLTLISLLLVLLPLTPIELSNGPSYTSLLWTVCIYLAIFLFLSLMYLAVLTHFARKSFNPLLRPSD